MKKSIVTQAEELSTKPVEFDRRVEFLDTGSTLLNLATSQRGIDGGWARGRVVNIVGDGGSGKTLLALEACANAFYEIKNKPSVLYPKVEDVQIVFNNIEGVMDFPIEHMYGQTFYDSVQWIQTPIAEDFGKDYQKRLKVLKKGQFLLYVVDSLDALVPQAAADRMSDILEDKKAAGSYGAEKAKFFSSSFFGHLCGAMEGKDATLICISQVRENIGIAFGEKYYRTGGKALDFYTHQVCWLAHTGRLKKTFRGQERIYGVSIKARIKRNKVAKPFREATFDILFDFGIDDANSMIDYIYGPKAKSITWKEGTLSREEFVKLLDDSPADLLELKKLVEQDWVEIEDSVTPKRKSRFEV